MKFGFEIIAPPPELAGRINTFYVIETADERIEECVPAYSAQMVVMIRGSLVIEHTPQTPLRAGAVAINAPQMKAAPCVIEGPALLIGASLTQPGWQELANLAVDEVHDQLLPPSPIFSDVQIAMLERAAAECAAGRITPRAVCDKMAAVVAAAPHAPNPDHLAVVEAMTRWLGSAFDPPLSALYDAVTVSPRQVQRISRRFFGVAPAQVLKRFRAIRAAMVLANPNLPDSFRDEMLASFFDQAHLIRDIRRYTGRTPTQLRARTLSAGLLDPTGHGEAAELLRPEAD